MAKANPNAASRPSADRRNPARRAAILAMAWEVFLKDGYVGASMADIAERLGGSKGTLYHYFSSKQELFRAVVEHKSDELYADVNDLPEPSGNLAKDLTEFGCQLLEAVLSEQFVALYRLIVAEAPRVPTIGASDYENRRQTVLGPFGKRIRDEMKAGRLRLADPTEAGEVFWNLCCATMHRRALAAMAPALSAEEIRHVVERAVTIFLAAYGTPKGKRGNPD